MPLPTKSNAAVLARSLVGLEINWSEVEALYEKIGMAPQVPSTASRVSVPVYRGGRKLVKPHRPRGHQH